MINPRIEKLWLSVFYFFSGITLIILFCSIYFENYYLLLIPPALLFLYLSINDIRFIYFLLLFMIPLSTEVNLPNGFATDFPTELLIGGLMILFFPLVLSRPSAFDLRFLKHPLIFLLLMHFIWLLVSTIYSSNGYVSLKYSLAKSWYIVTFVFVTSIMIKEVKDFKKAFWLLMLPLTFTVLYTLYRHGKTDFTFQTVNTPMLPFFRNHVNYACTLAQTVPLIILAISWYRKGTFKKRWLMLTLIIVLIAVYFSYTRSAWLALTIALVLVPVIRLRLMPTLLILGLAGTVGFFIYMGHQNEYLNHAPNFEQTVYHPELGEHLASTFEGKDVSSAERIYRWVAGVRMWLDKPWTGWGPGNFYNFYKSHAVTSFRTWVSENSEKSSIHNYFLLVLAEQGIIGLIIFIALSIFIFIKGQQIYHQTPTKEEKHYVMAILLCLSIIYVNTFLSDLIETDKIGSFYFICLALLVNQDIRNKELAADSTTSPAKL